MLHITKLPNLGYYNSIDTLVNMMAVGKDRERIDYVFYDTRHLVPKTAYNRVLILRALYDAGKWSKFDLSDHFPVEAYFDFSR